MTTNTGPRFALLAATTLVGLSAGFFFTYEASVTLGLADVSDVTYVETFRAINDTIKNPAFGTVFFGAVPALVVAIKANWGRLAPLPRLLVTAALPLYLIGLVVTGTGNVPLNDELASYDEITPSIASQARADFEDDWNSLNLIRALAIGASFVSLAGGVAFAHDEPE